MKNRLIISAFFSLLVVSSSALACDVHGKSGFMPKNKLLIPATEMTVGGISEEEFNSIMDRMMDLYSGLVLSTGRTLAIERLWNDGTVNAYAHRNYVDENTIVMFGGLARHPETTVDSMVLVACHELGHHLGGAPKKPGAKPKTWWWASNEGQADYWGTMKCFRHYFESDDNLSAIKNMTIPEEVMKNCQQVYKNHNDIALCKRSAMAGLALGRLLNAVANGKKQVRFDTPDQSVASKMMDTHPQAQCRLDTYFQASLCDHGFNEAVSDTDPNIGVCSSKNGDKTGNRPLCWFRP